MTAIPHTAQTLILQAFAYFQAIYFQAMGGGSKGCSLSSDMWLDCITKVELGDPAADSGNFLTEGCPAPNGAGRFFVRGRNCA